MSNELQTPDQLEAIRQLLRKIEEAATAQASEQQDRGPIIELKHAGRVEPRVHPGRELASLPRASAPALPRPRPLVPASTDGLPSLHVPNAAELDAASGRSPALLLVAAAVAAVNGAGALAYVAGVGSARAPLPDAAATKQVGGPAAAELAPVAAARVETAATAPAVEEQGPEPAQTATGTLVDPASRVPEVVEQPPETLAGTAAQPLPILQSGPEPVRRAAPAAADARQDATAPSDSPPPFALTLAKDIEIPAGAQLPFPIGVEPIPAETDALLLVIRGVPKQMTFSQGSVIGEEIWILPAHGVENLEFRTGENLTGSFPLQVDLVDVDGRVFASREAAVVTRSAIASPAASANER